MVVMDVWGVEIWSQMVAGGYGWKEVHQSPGLISGFSGGKKKSQNKNFDDHITTI